MIAEWLPQLLAAWAVQWLGVLSPGPGVALIMAVATSEGRGAALTTCLGIACGAVLLAILTVVGLAALFAQAVWAMTLVKFVGAAYLMWLAWQSFRKAMAPPPPPDPSVIRRVRGRAALAGFTMQMSNPKAIVYWLAVAAIADLGAAPMAVIALFVAGAFFNSFVGHGTWAVALSSRPFLALYRAGRRWIEGALGVFFAFAAFKLATART